MNAGTGRALYLVCAQIPLAVSHVPVDRGFQGMDSTVHRYMSDYFEFIIKCTGIVQE